MIFGQETYVGDFELSLVDPSTHATPPLSVREMVQVEVSREAHEEGSVLGETVREKVADASVPMGAAGGPHALMEPGPEDALGEVALASGSLRGSGFSSPRGAASDHVMSIPESFNIMDLGIGELGLSGYLGAPLLPDSWRQVAGGGGAKLTCSRVVPMH
jgi:hypothetical protein